MDNSRTVTLTREAEIIFCHLLNDASGSPRILKSAISALDNDNRPSKLFIGSSGHGILEGCGIPITRYWYFRSSHQFITLFTYLLSQFSLLYALISDKSINKNAVIYVNTLLPFGAAIFGKLTGRKVIYHVHEISIAPKPLRLFLCWMARLTSSKNIYVSKAHVVALPIANVPNVQIYNALDEEFAAIATQSVYQYRRANVFNILMIASLRDYKGIPELLSLVSMLEYRKDIRFYLVVNDEQNAIDRYFFGEEQPSNLSVHPRTDNTAIFYQGASLVLNLTRVDICIETFGLTILEAMAYGIPVIVSPVGGPAELVTDGLQGFTVDSRDTALLIKKVLALADNSDLCLKMSKAGRYRALDFSFHNFSTILHQTLKNI
jgi:glycosyltransferase involved in cell wall biosynthesis